MIRKRLFSFGTLACFAAALLAGPSGAQSQDKDRSASSLDQIADELRSDYGSVRFHRQEQLEDRFLVRGTSKADLGSLPKLYQIQAMAFDPSGTSLAPRVPANMPTMYVAVSHDDSRVYRLTGFEGAEEDFNRLVREGPVQNIITRQDAESRALLCAEVVYGLSPSWWLGGPLKAKLKAAEHFFAEGHDDGLLLADRWWKSAKGDRGALEIATANSGGAFRVSVPVFWAPVEGASIAQVRLYRIEVSKGGACTLPSPPTVVLQ